MSLTLASEPKRSFTAPIVIALLVLAAIACAVFYFNPHRTGELRATRTDIFAPQTTFKASVDSTHVVGVSPPVEHDLFVIVTLHLEDDLRLPLFVDEVDGKFMTSDGAEMDAVAPATADLARTQEIFPQLKLLMPHPLLMGDTVQPKSSVDGQVLLHFGNMGEKDWNARKPSTLTVHFQHQAPMTVAIP